MEWVFFRTPIDSRIETVGIYNGTNKRNSAGNYSGRNGSGRVAAQVDRAAANSTVREADTGVGSGVAGKGSSVHGLINRGINIGNGFRLGLIISRGFMETGSYSEEDWKAFMTKLNMAKSSKEIHEAIMTLPDLSIETVNPSSSTTEKMLDGWVMGFM